MRAPCCLGTSGRLQVRRGFVRARYVALTMVIYINDRGHLTGIRIPYGNGAIVADDELHFCWDDGKAAANLEKHGVSFETATSVFDDQMRLEHEDVSQKASTKYRHRTGEDVLLTVVYSLPKMTVPHHLCPPRYHP